MRTVMRPRLCLSLPLVALLVLGGCCCTPEPRPFFPVDAGPPVDAPFPDFRDAGPFGRDAALPVDASTADACTLEILGGALCDDEPCVAPTRRIVCPGGLQHVSVAAMDDGTTWISASYPPRLLHRSGEALEEHVLPLRGDGQARLLLDASGGLRALYADETLAIGALPDETGRLRLELRTDRAFWVPVGVGIDSADVLHVAWIDDGPALRAASGPVSDGASFVARDVSPTYFADAAMTLDPAGVPHVAFWRHRTPTDLGRDLYVRDGEGDPYAIVFHAEPNDDGTNVSLAASATAVVASLDFADGIHVLVPDDSVPETSTRDVLVPGSAPLTVSGCPALPPPGPFGVGCETATCTETGSGTLRRAHELVALEDGRFALVWLERHVERTMLRDSACSEAGCICRETPVDDRSTTDLVLGVLDEATGVPARLLVVPVGDVAASALTTALRGTRLVVATQGPETSVVLVEIELSFVLP